MDEHAVVMAKFAHECMRRMRKVTKQLEPELGPSTGKCCKGIVRPDSWERKEALMNFVFPTPADLQCRVGIHSGPVTGGVLRGKESTKNNARAPR